MLYEHKNKIPVYIIAILAGGITFFLSYSHNLGFSPDSVSYYEVANNIKTGNGFTNLEGQFINHWPPGYPLYISFISGIFGLSTLFAGTLGNAFIAFLTIPSLYKIFGLYRISSSISYLLLLLFIFSPIAPIYLWYLSEPLFIFLIILSFVFLKKWEDKNSNCSLFLSALILGISLLVRYAGIGFVAGYMLIFLFKNYKSLKHLISNLLFFLIAFLLPILPWILYTRLNDSETHDRNFSFELIPFSKVQEMLLSMGSWVFGNFRGLLFILATILVLILLNKQKLKQVKSILWKPRYFKTFHLPFFLSITYILFILFSATFLDHAIPLSNRIFSPIYPFFLIGLGVSLTFLSSQGFKKSALSLTVAILISYSFRSIPVYFDHYKHGSGFTSVRFSESPLLAYIRKNHNKAIIYTNDIFIPKVYTKNKQIKHLPLSGDSIKIKEFKSRIKNTQSVIIYLDSVNWRNYIISKTKLEKIFKDKEVKRFEDGIVIVNDESNSS